MSATILSNSGLQNADAIVQAAKEVGIELAIAAAFAVQESGGKQIYGHDLGGTYSTNSQGYNVPDAIGNYSNGSNIPVTAGNYWGTSTIRGFYNRVVVDKEKSNGVGIFQLTYRGFISDAKAKGLDLSVPLDNCKYGLTLIKGYLGGLDTEDQIMRAAAHYNAGSETNYASSRYAINVLNLTRKYRDLLAVVEPEPVPVPEPEPTPTPEPEPAPVPEPQPEPPVVIVPVPLPVPQPEPVPELRDKVRWLVGTLNLRTGPGIEYDLILTMARRAKVFLTGNKQGAWLEVVFNGTTGWCHGSYLSQKRPNRH